MGAWIEIFGLLLLCWTLDGRPRMGAWIEMFRPPQRQPVFAVAPAWGRGLKLVILG